MTARKTRGEIDLLTKDDLTELAPPTGPLVRRI